MLLIQPYQYPNLSEGADRVGGQQCVDKECPFSGVTSSGNLEEGAGKRCSESDQYPNLSEGADGVGGQQREDKDRVSLQQSNQFWQSLVVASAGKRCVH